ncbi:hypothetical protein, partial [Plasmodium yoelii yoelii]
TIYIYIMFYEFRHSLQLYIVYFCLY